MRESTVVPKAFVWAGVRKAGPVMYQSLTGWALWRLVLCGSPYVVVLVRLSLESRGNCLGKTVKALSATK